MDLLGLNLFSGSTVGTSLPVIGSRFSYKGIVQFTGATSISLPEQKNSNGGHGRRDLNAYSRLRHKEFCHGMHATGHDCNTIYARHLHRSTTRSLHRKMAQGQQQPVRLPEQPVPVPAQIWVLADRGKQNSDPLLQPTALSQLLKNV